MAEVLRKYPIRCTQSFVLRAGCLLLLAAAAVMVTGCYEVEQEVIRSSDAVRINGLPGTFSSSDSKMTISAVPGSNDYRFRRTFSDGSVESGYIRAIPLRDNIYIVQIKLDDESKYVIEFFQYNRKRINQILIENSYSDFERLAKQYNITFKSGELDSLGQMILDGSRSNILAFLRAHSRFRMRPISESDYDEFFW